MGELEELGELRELGDVLSYTEYTEETQSTRRRKRVLLAVWLTAAATPFALRICNATIIICAPLIDLASRTTHVFGLRQVPSVS